MKRIYSNLVDNRIHNLNRKSSNTRSYELTPVHLGLAVEVCFQLIAADESNFLEAEDTTMVTQYVGRHETQQQQQGNGDAPVAKRRRLDAVTLQTLLDPIVSLIRRRAEEGERERQLDAAPWLQILCGCLKEHGAFFAADPKRYGDVLKSLSLALQQCKYTPLKVKILEALLALVNTDSSMKRLQDKGEDQELCKLTLVIIPTAFFAHFMQHKSGSRSPRWP